MKTTLKGNRKEKTIITAVLTVLIIIMSFTPLGYFKMDRASITFLPILVVVGAVQYGPLCGLYLGTVFGVSSFVHCFAPSYAFGQTFLNISPFLLLLVCIIPRALMGLSCGLIHKLFSRNTFYNSDYIQNLGSNATQIIRTLITYNAYIEWIVCTIVGTLVPCIKARITKKNNADTVETDII